LTSRQCHYSVGVDLPDHADGSENACVVDQQADRPQASFRFGNNRLDGQRIRDVPRQPHGPAAEILDRGTVLSNSSTDRAVSTNFAPAAAKRWAIAFPIPRPLAVTSAT
jgi:hypothetical protein